MKSYYQTAFALGCDIGLCLVNDNEAETDLIFKSLWKVIGKFEAEFSRFLPNSELTVFNQNAGNAQPISNDFHEMLKLANQYNESSEGAFNIFILPELQKAGYKQPFHPVDGQLTAPDFSSRKFDTKNKVVIGYNTAKIPQNSAIDLGGIAKGFLADKLADIVQNQVHGYWLSIGGDIVVGGKNENGEKWVIGIESTDKTQKIEVSCNLNRFAVATSGISKRRGVNGNKNWHHIIDPKTGNPTNQDVVQSTIIAKTSVEADVLATCSVIVGASGAVKLLEKHNVLDALMQTKDQSGVVSFVQVENLIMHSSTKTISEPTTKELIHA